MAFSSLFLFSSSKIVQVCDVKKWCGTQPKQEYLNTNPWKYTNQQQQNMYRLSTLCQSSCGDWMSVFRRSPGWFFPQRTEGNVVLSRGFLYRSSCSRERLLQSRRGRPRPIPRTAHSQTHTWEQQVIVWFQWKSYLIADVVLVITRQGLWKNDGVPKKLPGVCGSEGVVEVLCHSVTVPRRPYQREKTWRKSTVRLCETWMSGYKRIQDREDTTSHIMFENYGWTKFKATLFFRRLD